MGKIGFGEKIFLQLFDETLPGIRGVLGYPLIILRPKYKDQLDSKVEFAGISTGQRKRWRIPPPSLEEVKNSLENDLLEMPSLEMLVLDLKG